MTGAMSRSRLLGALSLWILAACDAPVAPEPDKPAPASNSATKPAGVSSSKPVPKPAPTPSATAPAEKLEPKGPFPESTDPLMKDPDKAKDKAPDAFKVKFETTQGDFMIECTRAWEPHGVDRFYNLVKIHYFDDVAFFRVVQKPKPFVVQFGIHGNPEVSKLWSKSNIERGDVTQSNTRGTLTFAMSGATDTPKKTTPTRSTQLFFNYGDNSRLDDMGFAPICKVLEDGMSVVDKLYSDYGDKLTSQQDRLVSEGNAFLRQKYPGLDYIKTARLEGADKKDDKKKEGADKKDDKKKDAPPASSAAPKK